MNTIIKFLSCFMLASASLVGATFVTQQIEVIASQIVTVKQGESIQNAIDSLNGGGTVIVQEGTYNEFITFNNSGTEANPVVVKAEGKVVIDGQNKDGHLFDLNGKSHITIDGFTLINLKGNEVAGIYLGGGEQHIKILNNEMYNFNKRKSGSSGSCVNGIILFGESKTPISNVLIEGNHLHDMDLNWSEALSVTGNAEYVDVINNKVHDMTNIGIDFCGNFGYAPSRALDQPRHCTARGNVIYNCNSPYATSYGLYCDGAYDILFEDNIVYNCQGGIEVGAEEYVSGNYVGSVIVRNNLIYGCSENGLHVGGYDSGNNAQVEDVKVYNNTLVNNGEELFLSKCDNVELHNNIFINNRNSEILYNEFTNLKTKNVKFHNNLYQTKSDAEFYYLKKSYTQSTWLKSVEPTALFQDAKLNSNYLPTSNTPKGMGYQASTSSVQPEPSEPVVPEVPVVPEQPITPETPVVPEVPQEPEIPVQPIEPETPEVPVVPEEPEVPEQPAEENQSIIYTGAKYYMDNPTRKSASYFSQYDVIVLNNKYNNPSNSNYKKVQTLIEEIQKQNPDIIIVFADKLS